MEINISDFQKTVDLLEDARPVMRGYSDKKVRNEFHTSGHDVNDITKRKDKKVVETETVIKLNGEKEEIATEVPVPVTRLAVPFQKIIVKRSAAFAVGKGVELMASPQDYQSKLFFGAIQKIWRDTNLDYKSKEILRKRMSEARGVAELWYLEPVDPKYWGKFGNPLSKYRMKMLVLSEESGDKLYPYFDEYGNMVAFGRGYILNKVQHIDLFTDDYIYNAVKNANDKWDVTQSENLLKKIPVIFHFQEEPEWADVQSLINRFEKLISDHADTNEYFGSPMVKAEGQILSFAQKGETGKLVEMEKGGKIEYITWDQTPESTKLELENLYKLIHTMTQTPDISFESVKGIGQLSTMSLRILFMDPQLKAMDTQERFGEMIQRRINLLVAGMKFINTAFENVEIEISPKFREYVPANETELVTNLIDLKTNGLISTETALHLNPFVTDPEGELIKVNAESLQSGGLY